jgi:hypothetical protein
MHNIKVMLRFIWVTIVAADHIREAGTWSCPQLRGGNRLNGR